MLNRVLSDKRKLPKACVLPVSSKTRNPPAPDQVAPPAESSSLGVLVRRFTGAVPDALSALNSLETKKGEFCSSYAEYRSSLRCQGV